MNTQVLSFEELESAVGQGRRSISYAVLHSLFESTQKTANPVKDIIDCFIPFVTRSLQSQSGQQINLENLKLDVLSKFGIDLPIYTIEYMLPILQAASAIEYDQIAKIYKVCHAQGFSNDSLIIDRRIVEIEKEIQEYVTKIDASNALFSETWTEALISFLKPSSEPKNKPKKIKNVLISDAVEVERYVVADFIRNCHKNDPVLYSAILDVFVGVLIEDFIISITSLGSDDNFNNLTVYYDTAVLLRLLGTSGDLFLRATQELHRYIGDLNVKTEFFANNEDEVAKIISAIVTQGNIGSNIFGETGDALARGEVSMGFMRSLEHVFVERLSELNVFPAKYETSGFQKNVTNQIDERKFAEKLIGEARLRDRGYSQENADHDAISLGHVFRMRRGKQVRDMRECPGIFITANRLLASYSRRFLIEEGQMRYNEIPPVFHVSQACTIFWLAKDRNISEERASQQLLANCYDALRPDSDFYRELFSRINAYEGIEDTDPAIVTTVRRIAKQESFGRTAILGVLSPAEILAKAHEEVRIREESFEQDRQKSSLEAETRGREEAVRLVNESNRERAGKIANAIVGLGELFLCIGLLLGSIISLFVSNAQGFARIVFLLVAIIVIILTLLDYFRFWHLRKITDRFRKHVQEVLFTMLYR